MLRWVSAVFALFLGGIDAATAAAWVALARKPQQPVAGDREPRRGSMRDPAMAKIPVWVRTLFGLGGVAVFAAGILLMIRSDLWLWIYLAGWLVIQSIAIYNGITAYGNLRWSHHIVRLAVFGGLFVLGLLATS